MHTSELELLHRYLDATLPDTEADALQTLLRESAEARRMLRDLAMVDTKLSELAATSTAGPLPTDIAQVRPSAAKAAAMDLSGRISWRTLGGLALGLVIGVAFSSVAWAYAVPRWLDAVGQATTLVNEGFESTVAPLVSGLPKTPEVWGGDFTEVTAAHQGVAPASGGKMLRIVRADYEGKANSTSSYCGDLFRIVDLRPYRQQLANGKSTVELSAVFNAATFPEAEQYRCSLAIHALTADVATGPDPLNGALLANGSLAMTRQSCPLMDRDPATWQPLEGAMLLPAETEFLLIHIGVNHIPKFQSRVSFDGHYLDNVRLTLRHQP